MEGDGYLFVPQVVNNIVIPWHPVAPDPYTLLSNIPPKTSFFLPWTSAVSLSVFQLVHKVNFDLLSLGKFDNISGLSYPRGILKALIIFSQILKADLRDIVFISYFSM